MANKDSKYGGQGWRIASWVFWVLFLFSGLSSLLSGDFIPAITTLVIAVLLLPPIRESIYRKTGQSLSLWVRTLSIVILMVIIGRCTEPPEKRPSHSRREAATKSAPQPTGTSTPVERQAPREKPERDRERVKRTVEEKAEPEFVFTVEGFIERFDMASNNLKRDTRVSVKEELGNGEFLTIQLVASNKNMAMVLTANNKTRAVRDLIFIGSGDGTLDSGVAITFGILATVMAIENPLTPPSQRGEILKEIGFLELSDEGKVASERRGVKYNLSRSKVIGIMLTATPVFVRDFVQSRSVSETEADVKSRETTESPDAESEREETAQASAADSAQGADVAPLSPPARQPRSPRPGTSVLLPGSQAWKKPPKTTSPPSTHRVGPRSSSEPIVPVPKPNSLVTASY